MKTAARLQAQLTAKPSSTFALQSPAATHLRTLTPATGAPSFRFGAISLLPASRAVIQPKLEVGDEDDEHEKEAEEAAQTVEGQGEEFPPAGSGGGDEEEAAPADESPAGGAEETEEEEGPPGQSLIQRKAMFSAPSSAGEAPEVEDRLARHGAGGETLPAATLARMQAAYGHDFSRVRVHRDAGAAELCGQVSAVAFTRGSDIYFNSGAYDPEGSRGRRLLAHELTHVVQQGQAPSLGGDGGAGPAAASAAPPIQRTATWAAGAVHERNNLANCVINGLAVGVTWPILNGRMLSDANWSQAGARRAIARPTITFTPSGGGVDAKVTAVPTNTGSFDETVLSRGPWRLRVPKATIGTRFPTLAACTGAGNTRFRAIGDPNDAHMFRANRRHENHHANDHHRAFNRTIVPWDRRLTAAMTAGTTFHGRTNRAAERRLFQAMRGTPNQIANRFFDRLVAAVVAFHGTAAGGAVGAPTGPSANATCTTSSANYHNPS